MQQIDSSGPTRASIEAFELTEKVAQLEAVCLAQSQQLALLSSKIESLEKRQEDGEQACAEKLMKQEVKCCDGRARSRMTMYFLLYCENSWPGNDLLRLCAQLLGKVANSIPVRVRKLRGYQLSMVKMNADWLAIHLIVPKQMGDYTYTIRGNIQLHLQDLECPVYIDRPENCPKYSINPEMFQSDTYTFDKLVREYSEDLFDSQSQEVNEPVRREIRQDEESFMVAMEPLQQAQEKLCSSQGDFSQALQLETPPASKKSLFHQSQESLEIELLCLECQGTKPTQCGHCKVGFCICVIYQCDNCPILVCHYCMESILNPHHCKEQMQKGDPSLQEQKEQ